MESQSRESETETLPTRVDRGKKGNLEANNQQVSGKQEKLTVSRTNVTTKNEMSRLSFSDFGDIT